MVWKQLLKALAVLKRNLVEPCEEAFAHFLNLPSLIERGRYTDALNTLVTVQVFSLILVTLPFIFVIRDKKNVQLYLMLNITQLCTKIGISFFLIHDLLYHM
jgi:hypothetical protein